MTGLRRALTVALLFAAGIVSAARSGHAQAPAESTTSAVSDSLPADAIPAAAQIRPGVPFDPVAATDAYLATIPAEQRARSDAYFEGGYWIQLWDFLITVAVMLLLLELGWSRRMREWAQRRPARAWLQSFLYYGFFTLVVTAITLPFAFYTGFIREHQYGLSTQRVSGWLRDNAVALGLNLVLGGLAVSALYAVVRRLPRSWPVWGAAASVLLLVVGTLIGPVFIAPLFNRYTLLTDPHIREPILRLARTNGIATDRVYVVDASRQSTRVSANVSGLLGTERITLNDNLLRRATLPEIESVMGHEMGHYVLHHIYTAIIFFSLIILAAFAVLRSGFAWATARWGARWGVHRIDDPAGLPLVVLILSTFFFVLTPVVNTFVRSQEAAADLFGLNAARQPDAEALVDLKLADYRKLDPGPIEEFIFFDHPSGRARIYMAMRWKAGQMAPPAP